MKNFCYFKNRNTTYMKGIRDGMPSFVITPNPGGPMRSLTIIFCTILVVFSFPRAQAGDNNALGEEPTIQTRMNAESTARRLPLFRHNLSQLEYSKTVETETKSVAYAPQILWWYDLDAPSFGSAAVDDIDKDGKLEIVFGTYFNDEHIYALNADSGTLLWRYNTGGCNDASPAIADVDLDDTLEVVLPLASCNS